MTRPGWDQYFLTVAHAVATRADCRRLHVGAVIVDPSHRIIATGYNGSPPGHPSCLAGACPRAHTTVAPGSSYDTGPGSCIAVHAEANALLYAHTSVAGATLYVTHQPCGGCQRLIDASLITRTVVGDQP